MNDSQIEHLLHNKPRVSAPPELLGQLRAQINLEAPTEDVVLNSVPWWRRWVPALSLGAVTIACFVVIGVQTSELVALRSENQDLQMHASVDATVQDAPTDDAQDLTRRIEEAQNLRAEIEQLNQQLSQVQDLQTQNKALRDQIAAATARTNTEDPFAAEKAKAERVACMNNIKQIGLAARMWSNDHGEVFPMDFLAMQKELNTPKILTCPSETANLPRQISWDNFDPRNVSYEWLAAGHKEGNPEEVIARCRIHFNVGLADGSAHQFNSETMEFVSENGMVKVRRKGNSFE